MQFNLPDKFALLPRKKNTDKSHYGHALIIAGSKGMTGAAILSARAALASGSGLLTVGIPSSLGGILNKAVPEAMSLLLPETKYGSAKRSSYPIVKAYAEKRRVNGVLIGPGLSLDADVAELVKRLVSTLRAPLVLDADGINHFRRCPERLLKRRSEMVITPHQKEFERLFGKKLPKNLKQRIELAKKLSKFYHVVLVLKGHKTLVVSGDRFYINSTGNPGLAKGGSGDVLSGVLTAFICQGLEPFFASCWATYFHGKAADLVVREKGELSLVASDIIDFLPKAFKH